MLKAKILVVCLMISWGWCVLSTAHSQKSKWFRARQPKVSSQKSNSKKAGFRFSKASKKRSRRQEGERLEGDLIGNIGTVKMWWDLSGQYSNLELSGPDASLVFLIDRGLLVGGKFELVQANLEYWGKPFSSESKRLTTVNAGILSIFYGYKGFYFRGDLTIARLYGWNLPQKMNKLRAFAIVPVGAWKRLSLQRVTPLLPAAALGWHNHWFRFEAWYRNIFLQFDGPDGGDQVGAKIVLSTSFMKVELETKYQYEDILFSWHSNAFMPPASAVNWERSFWQTSLSASLDLSRLFRITKSKEHTGLLHLFLGARYRKHFGHQLRDSGELYINEALSHWSFTVGLRLGMSTRFDVMF